MSTPIIQSNNLFFTSLRRDELIKIMEWRNSQMNILRQFKPLTEINQNSWFENISTDPSQIIFSIYEKVNDESILIGYCGLTNICYKNRTGEISFLLDPEKGKLNSEYINYFKTVLTLLTTFAFNSLNLNKIFTETFSFRKVHISVIEEFGFYHEGTLREHIFENGKYCDSFIHSLLKKEWSN